MASDHSILVTNSDTTRLRPDYINNVLHQYDQMRDAKIPQAEIINCDAMKNEECLFLLERIRRAYSSPGIKFRMRFSTRSESCLKRPIRIASMLICRYQIFTIRMKSPLFINWREDRPDDNEFESELKIDFKKMLKMIDPTLGENYRFLSQNLDLESPWKSAAPGSSSSSSSAPTK